MVVRDARGRVFKDFAALERQALADAASDRSRGTRKPPPTRIATRKKTSRFRRFVERQRPSDVASQIDKRRPQRRVITTLTTPAERAEERDLQEQRDLPPPPTPVLAATGLPTAIQRGIDRATLEQARRELAASTKAKAVADIRAAGAGFVIPRNLIDKEGRIDTVGALRNNVDPKTLQDAGLSKTQVEAALKLNRELTALENIQVDEPTGRSPAAVKDAVKELLTFGAAETVFNRPALRLKWEQAKTELSNEYDRNAQAAAANGQRIITSKQDFITQNIGTEKAYVNSVIAAQPALASVAKEFGLASIPLYGTIRTWNESPNWGRALRIASDVLFFVPVVGQVSAATRAGTGFTTSAARVGVATVTGPVRAIRHPLRSVKATLEPFETALSPKKLPINVAEVRDATIRLPVVKGHSAQPGNIKIPASALEGLDRETGLVGAGGRIKSQISLEDLRGLPQEPAIRASMEWRDQVTLQAIKGETPTAPLPFGEGAILTPSIQKVVGPAAVHSSPDLRFFMTGSVVGEAKAGELFVAPGAMSRFIRENATGTIPQLTPKVEEAVALGLISKKPVPGFLLIKDPDLLGQLSTSNKLWQGTAEIERTLPVGTRIPAPSQFLFTRIQGGERVTIAVIGKPLTPAEILKLKFVGSLDTVKSIFSRPGRVKANKVTEAVTAGDETIDLLNQATLAESRGSFTQARLLRQRAAATGKRAEDALDGAQQEATNRLSSGAIKPVALYTGNQDILTALRTMSGPGRKTTSKAVASTRASGGVVKLGDPVILARGVGTIAEVGATAASFRIEGRIGGRPTQLPGAPTVVERRRDVRDTRAERDGRGEAQRDAAGIGDVERISMLDLEALDRGIPPGRDIPDRGIPPGRDIPDRGIPPGRGIPDRGIPPGRDIPDRSTPPGRDIPDRGTPPGRGIPDPGAPPPGRITTGLPPPGRGIPDPGAPGRAAPGFLLPTGERLEVGVFPQVVSWPQGETRVIANLMTGEVIYEDRKPDGTKPEQGFKVLRSGSRRPPLRVLEMGFVDVPVERDGIFFRARPNRGRPSISRRLIRRG